jgi:hypothetical protein
MNVFYVDTVPVIKTQKKEKKREVLEKNTIVNNKNAYVGVCLYFDSFFIKINFLK